MDWASVIGYQEREFLFVSFGCIALSARAQVKLWKLKMLFLRAIFCIRMKFQTTFLERFIISCTTLLLASIHEKRKWCSTRLKKLTNVLECVMFVSQFHVHCKIGTLRHRISFDSISDANSYQMSAKTTRKLRRVFYSSLWTNDYFKD